MISVRLPMPPRKSRGGIITPDVTRDLMAHNVQAGMVFAKGPLAFVYKADGVEKTQKINVGDWVLFRPFAGTMIQGGQVMLTSGWRYMSSFNDVIGIIPAAHMPDPATLDWGGTEDSEPAQDDFNFSTARRAAT